MRCGAGKGEGIKRYTVLDVKKKISYMDVMYSTGKIANILQIYVGYNL